MGGGTRGGYLIVFVFFLDFCILLPYILSRVICTFVFCCVTFLVALLERDLKLDDGDHLGQDFI